jgi:hypothetical protein
MLAAGTPPSPTRAPAGKNEGAPDPYHLRSSALVYAAANGDMQMLTSLLDAGAGVNEGELWSPALAAAARRGRLQAFRALLESGTTADAHTLISAAGSGNAEMRTVPTSMPRTTKVNRHW